MRPGRPRSRKAEVVSACPAPGRRSSLGDHGHARAAFRRAIERGNLVVAEIEARDIGQLDLGEALELTALVSLRDAERGRRYAMRWLARWLDESPAATLTEAAFAVGALGALGGPGHGEALASLRAMAERASTRGSPPTVKPGARSARLRGETSTGP
jgi:hypothetical protein